jgi:virginiamycin B lyase
MPDASAKDPHTLVFDHDGIIWFTVQAGNRVGRLDPNSGEIKLVTPPTANARPYGIVVNAENAVWFVEFGARLSRPARPRDRHREGMALAQRTKIAALRHRLHQGRGLVQRVRRKTHTIVRFDPVREKFQTWPIPDGGDIVRNMTSTATAIR